MWRWLFALAVIAGALAGIVLGALNPDPVTLKLFFLDWTASLGAIVALSVCAGLATGFSLAAALMLLRGGSRRTRLERTPEASKSQTNA